jgi:glutamine amidotransferase
VAGARDVAIVAGGLGNIRSVYMAITRLGYRPRLVVEPSDLAHASALIIPGVASWDSLLASIDRQRIRTTIIHWVESGGAVLGICAGLQVLFEESEEGRLPGLGLLKGSVVSASHFGSVVPRIGWDKLSWGEVEGSNDAVGFSSPHALDPFYFAHSYVCQPSDDGIVRATSFDGVLPAVAVCNRIVGLQFHPERSGRQGHMLLDEILHGLCET